MGFDPPTPRPGGASAARPWGEEVSASVGAASGADEVGTPESQPATPALSAAMAKVAQESPTKFELPPAEAEASEPEDEDDPEYKAQLEAAKAASLAETQTGLEGEGDLLFQAQLSAAKAASLAEAQQREDVAAGIPRDSGGAAGSSSARSASVPVPPPPIVPPTASGGRARSAGEAMPPPTKPRFKFHGMKGVPEDVHTQLTPVELRDFIARERAARAAGMKERAVVEEQYALMGQKDKVIASEWERCTAGFCTECMLFIRGQTASESGGKCSECEARLQYAAAYVDSLVEYEPYTPWSIEDGPTNLPVDQKLPPMEISHLQCERCGYHHHPGKS